MFNFKNKNDNYLIKNLLPAEFEKTFYMNPISILIYILFLASGYLAYFLKFRDHTMIDLVVIILAPQILLVIMTLTGRWEAFINGSFLLALILFAYKGINSFYLTIFIILGAIMTSSIQIAKEWQRAIILRFGKFKKVKGPGVFFLIPFIDTVSKIVDLRIRATDFVAETTLTKDSVTVTVDALCFWLVWDAEKAICEVENYVEAVVLSAKTALRNAVSMNDLSTLLERSGDIEECVRNQVDKKTTDWGITIQNIEIQEIKIPQELQDSMSRLAQAEREKKGRIQLGEAEIELAKKFSEASAYYKDNETALKLRKMHIINEGLKSGNSMVMVPSSMMENLDGDSVFGVQALDEIQKMKNKKDKNIKKS